MTLLDWIIIALYISIALAIGVRFAKKAARSTADFFVAGRNLHWFVAGTSIVATTFSSDTPLAVAGISRQSGIHGHWFWLSAAIGQVATVFFFARLWRRTEAITDIEFITKRYKPSAATSILRVFRVFFDGILINCVVMASVSLAMAKMLKTLVALPESPIVDVPFFGPLNAADLLLIILACAALLYSALSGLYGVVYTDMLQFGLAMVGSIGLAVIVYADISKGGGLLEKLSNAPSLRPDHLHFFPNLASFDLKSFTFFVYVSITWLARAPGNGYYVQRLLAARSERDSFLAFLWFNICQYVIRPWPWVFVGLVSLHYLPALDDHECSFPIMINLFLPAGLKGIMAAAMLAAFMSTIDTHLNWAASYIVNDFYQPFFKDQKRPSHYILVSRVTMVLLTIIALAIATNLRTIIGAYKYLGATLAGVGTAMIARWYWWRVNAFSEIAAIVTSLVTANYLQIKLAGTPTQDLYAVRVAITVAVVTTTWVIVTLLTSNSTPDKHIVNFYAKMRIPGPGWNKVAQIAHTSPNRCELRNSFIGWMVSVVCIYSATLAVGKLLLQQWSWALFYICLAGLTALAVGRLLAKMNLL